MKQNDLSGEVRQYVDEAAAQAAVGVQRVALAQSNYASIVNGPPGAPGAGPGAYIFAAILLTAKVSGIFQVGWQVNWGDGTTADSVTLAVGSTTASTIVMTHGTPISTSTYGFSGGGVGSAVGAGSAPGGYMTTTPGTSMVFTTTGSANSVTQMTSAYPTLTGLLETNGQTPWSGSIICCNSATGKTIFPIGQPVAFGLYVSATHTISIPSLNMFAQELAAA
jgi:hypothetical protein